MGNAVPEFAAKYGAEPLKVKDDRVHLLSDEEMNWSSRSLDAAGSYSQRWQSIAIRFNNPGKEPYYQGATTLVHEMLHFNSFQSLTLGKRGPRRLGLEVTTKKGDEYFNQLSEAVIDELTSRFLKEVAARDIGPTPLKENIKENEQLIALFQKEIQELKQDKAKRAAAEKLAGKKISQFSNLFMKSSSPPHLNEKKPQKN